MIVKLWFVVVAKLQKLSVIERTQRALTTQVVHVLKIPSRSVSSFHNLGSSQCGPILTSNCCGWLLKDILRQSAPAKDRLKAFSSVCQIF